MHSIDGAFAMVSLIFTCNISLIDAAHAWILSGFSKTWPFKLLHINFYLNLQLLALVHLCEREAAMRGLGLHVSPFRLLVVKIQFLEIVGGTSVAEIPGGVEGTKERWEFPTNSLVEADLSRIRGQLCSFIKRQIINPSGDYYSPASHTLN
ncbi:hypothetical protein ACP4OV_008782 [Aristida adscensionis]